MNEELTTNPVTGMTGVDPSGSLLKILQQIQAMQAAPLIPNDNPWAQAGAALAGLGAGAQGRPNPVMQQLMQQRQMDLSMLQQQAGIAGTMATIQHQKTQEETAKQARLDATKRLALDTFKEFKDSPDVATRLRGFEHLQGAGILGKDFDVARAAALSDKDFTKKYDEVLTIVASGEDPFASELFRGRYDPVVYGSVAKKAMDALAQPGGATQINAMKFNPKAEEGILKARATYLGSLPDFRLDENMRREKDALDHVLGLNREIQGLVWQWAKQLEREDAVKGVKRPFSAYLEAAKDKQSDKESYLREIISEAGRQGIKRDSPEFFAFIKKEEIALQAARAGASEDAKRLPERERAALTVLDLGKYVIGRLTTEFTPQERHKYAGWFNYKGNQLKQVVAADPKFAQFRSLVNQGRTMAFSDGGKQLTQYEAGITFGWVPTGDELSPVDFEEKLKLASDRLDYNRQRIIYNAVTPSKIFEEQNNIPPMPVSPGGVQFRYEVDPATGRVKVIAK